MPHILPRNSVRVHRLCAAKGPLRASLRSQRVVVAHAAETEERADVADMSNEELKDQLRFIIGEPELEEGEYLQYDGTRCVPDAAHIHRCMKTTCSRETLLPQSLKGSEVSESASFCVQPLCPWFLLQSVWVQNRS